MKEGYQIPQMQPFINQIDREKLIEYVNSDAWYTEHRVTKEFEAAISNFTNIKHAIAVNNGTISLTVILIALGIKNGDEYIVPNYTMIATANSGVILGAVPVFCDVEFPSLYLDLKQVESKITTKTKAIILVNANGRYPAYNVDDLLKLCSKYNISLIEDTAQGLGSYYPDGKHLGSKGIACSISFSMPKIITTGQGGMILTNDDSLADKIRLIKDFGRVGGGLDIHDVIGYNFKFTDLQATLGLSQFSQLPSRIKRKREIFDLYNKYLCKVDSSHLELLSNDLNYTTPWFYEILVEKRDALKNYLRELNIGTRDMYPPINKQNAYNQKHIFPVSENIGKKGLWLPSYVQLTDEDVATICKHILEFTNF